MYLKVLFAGCQIPISGCEAFSAPVADEEFLERKFLIIEGEPAIQVLELIILSRKAASIQMTCLQSQGSGISEINLKGEDQLGGISSKVKHIDLLDQEPEKFLSRFFIRPIT